MHVYIDLGYQFKNNLPAKPLTSSPEIRWNLPNRYRSGGIFLEEAGREWSAGGALRIRLRIGAVMETRNETAHLPTRVALYVIPLLVVKHEFA